MEQTRPYPDERLNAPELFAALQTIAEKKTKKSSSFKATVYPKITNLDRLKGMEVGTSAQNQTDDVVFYFCMSCKEGPIFKAKEIKEVHFSLIARDKEGNVFLFDSLGGKLTEEETSQLTPLKGKNGQIFKTEIPQQSKGYECGYYCFDNAQKVMNTMEKNNYSLKEINATQQTIFTELPENKLPEIAREVERSSRGKVTVLGVNNSDLRYSFFVEANEKLNNWLDLSFILHGKIDEEKFNKKFEEEKENFLSHSKP